MEAPKLVMTLIAKDEIDIIRYNIEFHLKRGVDFFIATDNDSNDGTRDVFLEYASKGLLFFIDEKGNNFDKKEWVNRMGKIAFENFNAEVIIHNDADEFWYPLSGNLKDDLTLHEEADVLIVDRINVVLENKNGLESFPNDTKYAVINPIISENTKDDSKNKNLYFFKLQSKLATRTSRTGLINVTTGNHAFESTDTSIIQKKINNIEIYHFPVRSKKQFEKRVITNGISVRNNTNLGKEDSWHIKRWYDSFLEGNINSDYNQILINKDEALELIKYGFYKEIDFMKMFL
jgi:hypothetical protein